MSSGREVLPPPASKLLSCPLAEAALPIPGQPAGGMLQALKVEVIVGSKASHLRGGPSPSSRQMPHQLEKGTLVNTQAQQGSKGTLP